MAVWRTNKTLLLVGEGRTEQAFLEHVKLLYAPRDCGLSVKVKNARGKGAKHVVEWTIQQLPNAKYDLVAVLLDTDQDWSDAVALRAKRHRINVLTSEPLFEALMLRVLGESDVGDAKALKRRLAPFMRDDATISKNYSAHFGIERLEAQRLNEPTIDALLNLFIV